MKALLVPITQSQMPTDELQALAEHGCWEAVVVPVVGVSARVGSGPQLGTLEIFVPRLRYYELSREDHLLALQSDQDLITTALRGLARGRCLGGADPRCCSDKDSWHGCLIWECRRSIEC